LVFEQQQQNATRTGMWEQAEQNVYGTIRTCSGFCVPLPGIRSRSVSAGRSDTRNGSVYARISGTKETKYDRVIL
jgi:hypothetical protein